MTRYLQVSHEIASNVESGLLSPGDELPADTGGRFFVFGCLRAAVASGGLPGRGVEFGLDGVPALFAVLAPEELRPGHDGLRKVMISVYVLAGIELAIEHRLL